MESLPDAMLTQIAELASEPEETPLTNAQVAAILSAREAIIDGDPVGTVKKGPENQIAVRVNDAGFHMWRVTCTDGTFYNDTTPRLDWPEV